MDSFSDVIDKSQISKAAALPPMSVGMLFRRLFDGRMDKYHVHEKEYIRLIYTEIERLRTELDRTRSACRSLSRELDRQRQTSLLTNTLSADKNCPPPAIRKSPNNS
jgi:hypothetical protein